MSKLLRIGLAAICVGCGRPVLKLESQYRADYCAPQAVDLAPVQWEPSALDAKDLTVPGWYGHYWGDTKQVDQLWEDYFRRSNVVDRVFMVFDEGSTQRSPISVRLHVTKFRTQVNKGEATANSIVFGFVTWLAIFFPISHELELETRLEVINSGPLFLESDTWSSGVQKRGYSLVNRAELIGRDMSSLFESAFRAHCQYLAVQLKDPRLAADQ